MAASEVRHVNAVRVLPVAVGGCGACAQSVRALLAPRYAAQLRQHSISFTEAPRHADVALVTGAITQRGREAALRYIEGIPHPRVLVAVGNCAIDGCVFAGSPDLGGSTAEALNVHVEIGGCPPEPEAILTAIVQAAQLLAEVNAEDTSTENGGDGRSTEITASGVRDDEEGRDA